MIEEDKVEAQPEDTSVDTTTEPTTAPKGLPEDQEWGRVDLPPEAQRRFNRLYAQIKTQERIQARLAADNAALADKLAALENKSLVQDHTKDLASLKAARKQAWIDGNLDLADELDEKIYEFRTNAPKVDQPKTTQTQVPQIPSAIQARVADWIGEADEEGNLLRPYAHPGHPKFEQFKNIVAGIMSEPTLANTILNADDGYSADVSAIFDKVEAAMIAVGLGKAKKQKVQPPVLSPSAKGSTTKEKTGLTNDEVMVAKKMYRGDPDPIARYKKAKESMSR